MTKTSSVVLGSGCFWCTEAAYQQVEGVIGVMPGYAGGSAEDARYDRVCTGSTGHVEVVMVTYDPATITLETLLAIFWVIHDPTSRDRQGADVGPQYASVIFYASDEQRVSALLSRDEAQSQVESPIVTRIEPLETFYEAEPYHHNYFESNPTAGYCQAVIEPKLTKLRQHFSPLLKG